jgi:hypothetical protein
LLEKELIAEYKKALKVLKKEIGKYYEKYDMTYQEMNKYNRLKNLKKTMELQVGKLAKSTGKSMRGGLGEIYRRMYYATGYAMEKGVQAKLGYTMVDPAVVSASIQNPISGLTLNERLRENERQVIIKVKAAVTQGLMIPGTTYGDMVGNLTKVFEGDLNKALRVARTETHRCQEIARRESIEHAERQGVKGRYMWNASLDGRTRDSHASMDGKYADKDGYFTLPSGIKTKGPGLTGIASEDINCRCDIIYVIDGFEPKERRVRGEGVVPYKTYAEWYDNRLVG